MKGRKSKISIFLLAMVMTLGIFSMANGPGAEAATPTWDQYCSRCHGSASSFGPRTVAKIQSALTNINEMKNNTILQSLTAAQIQTISTELSGPPPVTAPVISSFTANPGSITSGQSSTLSWTLSGGAPTTLTLNGGSVLGLTSQLVSPTTTTLYTLTASNSAGSVSQSATVTVSTAVTAPVISSFTANPISITSGQSSTLSWSLSGGAPTTLTLNGGSVLSLNSQTVSPTTTTLYTLTASNTAGSVSQSVTVTITAAPQPGLVDLTNWSGQWLKTIIRYDGYYFGQSTSLGSSGDEATPKMNRDYQDIGAYLKFGSWDPQQNVLQGELYQYDTKSNQWVSDPLAFHLIGGTPTDFLLWTQVNGDFTSGFTVRIQGRETGGILKSATFRTLGGYYLETSSGTPVAGKISISGSLVPESKVPVPK